MSNRLSEALDLAVNFQLFSSQFIQFLDLAAHDMTLVQRYQGALLEAIHQDFDVHPEKQQIYSSLTEAPCEVPQPAGKSRVPAANNKHSICIACQMRLAPPTMPMTTLRY